jgi:hypothetical protein
MSTIETSITQEVGKKIMDAGFGTYFDSPISVLCPLFEVTDFVRAVFQEPKTAPYPSW